MNVSNRLKIKVVRFKKNRMSKMNSNTIENLHKVFYFNTLTIPVSREYICFLHVVGVILYCCFPKIEYGREKWVPRLDTRGTYPIFHIKFDDEVKDVKYIYFVYVKYLYVLEPRME